VNPRTTLCAIAGGVAFVALGAIGATQPTFDGDYDSAIAYVNDLVAIAALVLTVPGLLALRHAQGAPRGAVECAAIGQGLIAVGIAAGVALGEDPSWFMALGGPGLLLWLVATARLGLHTWRVRLFPRWTALALALTVPVGMILGELGGSILPGILWIYLGSRMWISSRAAPHSSLRPSVP
jgi:hypothetical protein